MIASEVSSRSRSSHVKDAPLRSHQDARSERNEENSRGQARAAEGVERSGPQSSAHGLQRRLHRPRQARICVGANGGVLPRQRFRYRRRRRRRQRFVQADLVCRGQGPQPDRRQTAARARRAADRALCGRLVGRHQDPEHARRRRRRQGSGRRRDAVSRLLGLETLQGRQGARAEGRQRQRPGQARTHRFAPRHREGIRPGAAEVARATAARRRTSPIATG